MSFSELERKRVEKEVGAYVACKRPPAQIRPELDIGFRIENQSVEIFEIRPDWQDRCRIMEHPVAKTTYVKTRNRWKIYWMRADLKWHGYEPNLWVNNLAAFLQEVEIDPYACFWG